MRDSKQLRRFWEIVLQIYEAQRKLHGLGGELFLEYTLDGRLVEHLGLFYATEAYQLSPLVGHGRRRKFLQTQPAPVIPVEIHTTQDTRPIYIGSPNSLERQVLIFFLSRKGKFQTIYNGPRRLIDQHIPQGAKSIVYQELQAINTAVPISERLPQLFDIPSS